MRNVIFLVFLCIWMVLLSCRQKSLDKVEFSLQQAGNNRSELEKVINHFKESGDPKKLEAAYYIIKNLPDQYHYEGTKIESYQKTFKVMDSISSAKEIDYYYTWDSLQSTVAESGTLKVSKIYDIQVLTAKFLIRNIEEAFKAWNYPWAKDLSFDEFKEYLLPYKLRNEQPEDWRFYFQKRYKWVLDSMGNSTDARKACILINNDLKKWIYIIKLSCPFDLSFSDLMHLRSGRCSESTQLTAYAMRAMGIPVTLDYVPVWGNRNYGHDWNGLYSKGKVVPFLGAELNPGVYKIQFQNTGSVRSKWPKVFRKTFSLQRRQLFLDQRDDAPDIPKIFLDNRYQDVTKEYALSFDVELNLSNQENGNAYLCVFNDRLWRPVHSGIIDNGICKFFDMGSDILYLPVTFEGDELSPINSPFLLAKDGQVRFINPVKNQVDTISIDRKYPVDQSNKVAIGKKYELFYWDNKWKSLGKQTASENFLVYTNVPRGALLWLRNFDEGVQERIFTIENGIQIWW